MIRGIKKLALAAIVLSGCTVNYVLPPAPSQSVTPNQSVAPTYTAPAAAGPERASPEPEAVIQPSSEDYTVAFNKIKALNDDQAFVLVGDMVENEEKFFGDAGYSTDGMAQLAEDMKERGGDPCSPSDQITEARIAPLLKQAALHPWKSNESSVSAKAQADANLIFTSGVLGYLAAHCNDPTPAPNNKRTKHRSRESGQQTI